MHVLQTKTSVNAMSRTIEARRNLNLIVVFDLR
jgi:hypothetical protein